MRPTSQRFPQVGQRVAPGFLSRPSRHAVRRVSPSQAFETRGARRAPGPALGLIIYVSASGPRRTWQAPARCSGTLCAERAPARLPPRRPGCPAQVWVHGPPGTAPGAHPRSPRALVLGVPRAQVVLKSAPRPLAGRPNVGYPARHREVQKDAVAPF